jgi:uncharacterized MAPEG superfamily protein
MAGSWRKQRKAGIAAIAAALVIAAALWLAIRFLMPPLDGMESLSGRMLFALKCCCVAVLFCLVTGVEAVAHERLQSAAFDPLQHHRTRRLEVNSRYLQNTLEQIVVFAAGLFGLAAYSVGGDGMRSVLATTVVWILSRFAFWIGYHRSAAMRGLGAPGMMAGLLMLLYVVGRIGDDVAGTPGAAAALVAFLLFEALLFRATRAAASTAPDQGGDD